MKINAAQRLVAGSAGPDYSQNWKGVVNVIMAHGAHKLEESNQFGAKGTVKGTLILSRSSLQHLTNQLDRAGPDATVVVSAVTGGVVGVELSIDGYHNNRR